MSAVFGILRFDGGAVSPRDLERMGNTLSHRGPDGKKFVVDGLVGLGHCLMRVNNEDVFEAQPLIDREADLTLVADCRIDNREELADGFGLSAADIRDLPDSQFILRAYMKWGEDCAEHLLGDFAFAIWDGRARKLVLARDHMGQRSVFYHKGEDFFAFATEIKALWALPDVPRALQEAMIGRRLMPLSMPPRPGATLFENIAALLGGTACAVTSDGALTMRRYWEPHGNPTHEGRDEAYYVAQYRAILAEAVACRLRRLMHPAALMFSAGYDTAAIAGLAGPVVRSQGRKLLCFSAVVSEAAIGTKEDIRPHIEACRRVMPHLDIHLLPPQDNAPLDRLEHRFLAHDGPASAMNTLNHWLPAEARAAGARSIMDGLGGDYSVNPRGQAALARLLRKGRLMRFVSELFAERRLTGRSLSSILGRAAVTALLSVPCIFRLSQRLASDGRDLSRYAAAPSFAEKLRQRGELGSASAARAIPPTEMRAQITAVAKHIQDQSAPGPVMAAAMHGLILTQPFHDKRVIELGLAVPEDLYVKNGRNRYLACQALADLYPPEFQTRGRGNDRPEPEFHHRLRAHGPALAAEAESLAADPVLSTYVDFAALKERLTAQGTDKRSVTKRRMALEALIVARYVAWFRGANQTR